MHPKDLAFMMVINLVWGLGVVATKVSLDHFPAFMFSGMRSLLILALIWPFLRWKKGRMKDILIISACMGPISFGLAYMGFSLATASVMAVVSQLGVPFATIMSVVFLKEHVGWRRWSGIALAFLGVGIISFDPSVFHYLAGILFMTGSVIAWAVSTIYQRRLRDVGVYELQAWIALVTLPSMFAASMLFESNQIEAMLTASLVEWGGCFYLAFGATLIGHAGMFYLLQRYEVAQAAPLTLLSPIAAILFSIWLLGDVLTPLMVVGSLVTLGGVLIISLRQRKIVDVSP